MDDELSAYSIKHPFEIIPPSALHREIIEAFGTSQKLNHEHGLLIFEIRTRAQCEDLLDRLLERVHSVVPNAKGMCQISSHRFALLLENKRLIVSLRRSQELSEALCRMLEENESIADSCHCWVGIAPISTDTPRNSAKLLWMALLACNKAKQTGRRTAVRIYHPSWRIGMPAMKKTAL